MQATARGVRKTERFHTPYGSCGNRLVVTEALWAEKATTQAYRRTTTSLREYVFCPMLLWMAVYKTSHGTD